MKLLRPITSGAPYYASWLMFGLGGLLLNLVLAPLLLMPRRESLGALARRAIRGMFSFWVKWLHACGVIEGRWRGFDQVPLRTGTVYVANHPSLVDATFLLARLPDAVCIFKPSLLGNPAIAPAALLAGYLVGDQGVDTIRAATEAVTAGRSLLIFPEGTRTYPGAVLNPLKPGFALIARRAGAPVQVVRLRTSPDLGSRGLPWWRLPALPGWIEITRDELIKPEEHHSTAQLVSRVEQRLRAGLRSAG